MRIARWLKPWSIPASARYRRALEGNATRVRLRSARDADAVLFYRLRLDLPETMGQPVTSWQQHVDFFCRHLSGGVGAWFVAEADGDAEGVLRLDCDEQGNVWVSIVVDAAHRRHGVGLAMLRQLDELWSGVLFARVHEENAPSRRLFAKAGFLDVTTQDHGRWRVFRRGARF